MANTQGFPEDTEVAVFTRNQFGEEWPLTVDEVFVYCRPIKGPRLTTHVAYLVAPDGKQYAVNGTAKGHTGFPGVDAIWADAPGGLGLKQDIGPFINGAVLLCP